MPNPCKARIAAVIVAAWLVAGAGSAVAAGVRFECSGAKAEAARKTARDNGLKLGMNAQACFGEMQLTASERRQIVVAAPAPGCKGGRLLDVYDRSRAGSWYALFRQPVCGKTISVGPRSPYGDNMITIDGQRYMDKAGVFAPVK